MSDMQSGSPAGKSGETRVAVLYSGKFLLHDTGPGHPEGPARLERIVAGLKGDAGLSASLVWPEFGPATIVDLVDFDVHHGNGTQDIFYGDDSVFYFSVHQHPLYPGTGRTTETGKGKGAGFTFNVELAAGSGDDAPLAAFRDRLKPAIEAFKPEFILVSAGFDGHAGDPLGGLRYSDDGYAAMARALLGIAEHYASGHIVFLLEGGYAPAEMARAVAGILTVLKGE